MIRAEINKKIISVLEPYAVKKIAVFGSYARGDDTSSSDIDILVDLPEGLTLLDFVGMKMELEESLNKKVDLITYKSIHKLLRKAILSEQKVLYEKIT